MYMFHLMFLSELYILCMSPWIIASISGLFSFWVSLYIHMCWTDSFFELILIRKMTCYNTETPLCYFSYLYNIFALPNIAICSDRNSYITVFSTKTAEIQTSQVTSWETPTPAAHPLATICYVCFSFFFSFSGVNWLCCTAGCEGSHYGTNCVFTYNKSCLQREAERECCRQKWAEGGFGSVWQL